MWLPSGTCIKEYKYNSFLSCFKHFKCCVNQEEFFFYSKSGEALEQAAQRGGGCHIPGDIRGQTGRGCEYLMELWMPLLTAEELN